MDIRKIFINHLNALDDVEVGLWKDTELLCVFYRGKEFAHFHDNEEIDIRLSQKFIKQEELVPLENSPYHPKRSKKSRWMQFRFDTEQDMLALVGLIERLLQQEYTDTK
ncbi:MAG: luciferase family protein [Chloroflexota bacterium]